MPKKKRTIQPQAAPPLHQPSPGFAQMWRDLTRPCLPATQRRVAIVPYDPHFARIAAHQAPIQPALDNWEQRMFARARQRT